MGVRASMGFSAWGFGNGVSGCHLVRVRVRV